jgi:SsrA-binding protein
MAKPKGNVAPRIANRRALHEFFIESKLECGIALVGSEVKSIRDGRAVLQDAYARVEHGELMLHELHIDPYTKAAIAYSHEPRRPRKLLAHKQEIKRLEEAQTEQGTTLVPLALYFKDGRVKVELAVARGKQRHDKRQTIKEKEISREIRRATTVRQ